MARLSKEIGNTQHDTVMRQKVIQADGTIVYKQKDAMTEIIMKRAMEARKKHDVEKAQKAYAQGNVQKQQLEDKARYLTEMADAPFARMADDAQLEKELKSVIHGDDPMAAYFHKKQVKKERKHGKRSKSDNNDNRDTATQVKQKIEKPKYKGPWKPPNRFDILPGYRWDGVDRGNGFEDRLNRTINEKQSYKDNEYRWSTQDM